MSASGLQTFVMEVLGEGAPPEDQVKTIIEQGSFRDHLGNIVPFNVLDVISDKKRITSIKHSHGKVFRVSDEDTSDHIKEVFDSFEAGERFKMVFETLDRDGSGRINTAELKAAFSRIGESLVNLLSFQSNPSNGPRHLLGRTPDNKDLDRMVEAVARLDGSKRINFREFFQVGSDPRLPVYMRAHACVSL